MFVPAMKTVAYIFTLCMIALGSPGFPAGWQEHQSRPGTENLMACCTDHGQVTSDLDSRGKDCCSHHGEGHHCPFNCDCNCCLHVTAMACQFQASVAPAPITFHFGTHRDTYTFDYFNRLFQPPRIG